MPPLLRISIVARLRFEWRKEARHGTDTTGETEAPQGYTSTRAHKKFSAGWLLTMVPPLRRLFLWQLLSLLVLLAQAVCPNVRSRNLQQGMSMGGSGGAGMGGGHNGGMMGGDNGGGG